MKSIEEIIGKAEAEELKAEFNDIMWNGGDYDDVEELLLGYGLEMDFVEQLMW